jgi:Tol biopolymer transport system component
MSPEQARGRETDSRTDVWAFGCVVYEMLTGRQAFYGETVTDIIAKIIEAEPKWDALPPGTPQSLRRLLRATLHKDLKQRLQHIGDSRLFLDGTLTSDASPVSQSRSFTRRTWLAAAGGLAAGALLPTAAYFLRRTEQPRNAFRFERPAAGLVGNTLAISPDGEYVGYIVVTDGRRSIWTGPLGGEAKLLSGTQGSSGFFWSPDSSQIAFFQEQQLKKMVRSGGNVTVIRPSIVVPPNASGSWGPDGTILVSLIRPPTLAPMMHRISERGGEPVPITENDSEQPVAQGTPQFLPDGQHYLFHEVSISAPGRTTVRVGSLHSKDVVDVMTLESALSSPVKYAEPGYFLFSMSGTLMAQRFDVRSLKVLGTPLPVVEQITSAFSASNNGRLVYAHTSGNETPQRPHQLSWFDRNGKPAGQLGEPSTYTSVALSRDERKLAVAVGSGANRDIYVFDVDRGTRERLTSADAPDSIPVWEPAGGSDRIVFASQRGDNPIRPPKLYIRASTSVGQDTLLYEGNPSEGSLPQDWCTEGILFVSRAGLNAISWDLWLQPPTPGQEPREYLKTAFRKIDAQVSPNGKWVAFTTNETGSDQVVVQAFPDPDLGRRTVTANGGMLPRWRKDGRELYYLAPDRKLMAVSVKDPATMSFGETTTLFATELPTFGTREPTVGVVPYDVADNGQRFLLIASAQSTTTPGGAAGREPSSIHGILDWTSLLKN